MSPADTYPNHSIEFPSIYQGMEAFVGDLHTKIDRDLKHLRKHSDALNLGMRLLREEGLSLDSDIVLQVDKMIIDTDKRIAALEAIDTSDELSNFQARLRYQVLINEDPNFGFDHDGIIRKHFGWSYEPIVHPARDVHTGEAAAVSQVP